MTFWPCFFYSRFINYDVKALWDLKSGIDCLMLLSRVSVIYGRICV